MYVDESDEEEDAGADDPQTASPSRQAAAQEPGGNHHCHWFPLSALIVPTKADKGKSNRRSEERGMDGQGNEPLLSVWIHRYFLGF